METSFKAFTEGKNNKLNSNNWMMNGGGGGGSSEMMRMNADKEEEN